MWTAHSEGLPALHPLEQRGVSVFLSPDAGQPAGSLGARIEHPADQRAGHACLDRAVRKRMAAKEVVLTIRNSRVVRVRGGPKTELVWIKAFGFLHSQTVLERLPSITTDDVWDTAWGVTEQDRHDLEAGELIVRRERRMGFRCALELLNLDQPLIANPRLGIGRIDWPALTVHFGWVHATIRKVGVVRNSKQLVTGFALVVHPFPEIDRIDRVQRAE